MLDLLRDFFGGNKSYTDLDGVAFREMIRAEKAPVILDVRSRNEYKSGHLPGALNADVLGGSFEAGVRGLKKDQACYVYCRSGMRSRSAASALARMGFSKVYNLSGGLSRYPGELN